jgi:hypothetical protein
VDGREVVVFDLAEFQEAEAMSAAWSIRERGDRDVLFAELGSVVSEQVNDNVTDGCF